MIDLKTKYLTVFGAGSFGSEIIQRLLQVGLPKDQITICDPDRDQAHAIARQYDIRQICTADQAICETDALLLALPAKDSLKMLQKVTPCLFPKVLVISFSPLSILAIEELLRPTTPVAKIKPNLVVHGNKGKRAITYGKDVKPEDRELAEAIFAAIGELDPISVEKSESIQE